MKELLWNEYKETLKKGIKYTPYKITDSEEHIFMLDDKCNLIKVQLPH